MESVIIRDVNCTGNRLEIAFDVSAGLERFFASEHRFWAEYSCDISDVPKSVLVLPILCNLLQFSWLVDCIVWVDEIDRVFYEQIPALKAAFRELYPGFPFGGTLIPARLRENHYEPQRSAVQLFTGGVDATTTFLRIRDQKPILFNTNGWYRNQVTDDPVYTADKTAIDAFARENGVEAHDVRSNFCTFLHASAIDRKYGKRVKSTWWFGFQHSLAFLGCAAVLGYHFRVGNVFIASSYTFGEHMNCVSDPRIDNLFRCASLQTIHDGYELSRQEKIGYIVNSPVKVKLRVCSFHAENCCRCEKCFRTMLAVAAEGGDPADYGFVLKKTMLEAVKEFLRTSIMELDNTHMVFWRTIIDRMGENQSLTGNRELYELLRDYPYKEAKKRYLYDYYSHNFFKILKRKLQIRSKENG